LNTNKYGHVSLLKIIDEIENNSIVQHEVLLQYKIVVYCDNSTSLLHPISTMDSIRDVFKTIVVFIDDSNTRGRGTTQNRKGILEK
jgi:hypothetical protein